MIVNFACDRKKIDLYILQNIQESNQKLDVIKGRGYIVPLHRLGS